jgi:photosystem II stability/assembly factor-like uncharacterized protein
MKRIILILVVLALACGQALATIGYATWGTATSGRIVKITGTTAAQVYAISNHKLYGISIADYNTAFVVGMGKTNNAIILRTLNSGTSWDSTIITTVDTLYSVSMYNTNLGYCCGVNGKIYKTSDGGGSWSALTSGITSNLFTVQAITSTIAFCAGDSGKILKTTDAGTNWALQTLPGTPTNKINDISFISANVGWAGADSGKVFKTINGGTTWLRQSSPTHRNITSISAYDQSNAIFATGDSVIFKTTNGDYWSKITPSIGIPDIKYVTMASQFEYYAAKEAGAGRIADISVDGGLTFTAVTGVTTADVEENGLAIFTETPINNRYISTLLSAQDIDSTFSYYTPPVLANNFGWFGLYVYSYGTTPRYKITLEGAPTLSDPFIAPADSIVADSCGMAGFVNQWVTLRVPPGQYFRLKFTGLSGNGANTTNTSKLYSWGQ